MKNLLPNKLSDCIDVALKDLDAAKKLGFKVNMKRWYQRRDKTCTVCLAGAVLAREFDLDKHEELGPENAYWDGLISDHDYDRLQALNLVRIGWVLDALNQIDPVHHSPGGVVENYFTLSSTGDRDTKEWRKNMFYLRDYLREQGL